MVNFENSKVLYIYKSLMESSYSYENSGIFVLRVRVSKNSHITQKFPLNRWKLSDLHFDVILIYRLLLIWKSPSVHFKRLLLKKRLNFGATSIPTCLLFSFFCTGPNKGGFSLHWDLSIKQSHQSMLWVTESYIGEG